MKSVLKLGRPMSEAYAHSAHLLSIISAHNGEDPWLLNSFVQLYAKKDGTIDYQDFGTDDCPIIHMQHIGWDMVLDGWKDRLSFIRNAIMNGYYIYTEMNVNKIGIYHKQNPTAHNPLIYGFDDVDSKFLLADYFSKRKYCSEWVPCEEVHNALIEDEGVLGNTNVFYDDVYLLKIKKRANAVFYPEKVRESLELYMNEKPVTLGSNEIKPLSNIELNNYYFGKGCYHLLRNMIQSFRITNEIPKFFFQSFFVLFEHKQIMVKRIQYLGNLKRLNNFEVYLPLYIEIEQKTEMIKNLCLKYVIKREYRILDRVEGLLHDVEEMEINILPRMITDIV